MVNMAEPLTPSQRHDLYTTLSVIGGVIIIVLFVITAVLWDSLDTAHEEVEAKLELEKLAVMERMIGELGVNPIVADCILNPPENTNNKTPRMEMCVYASGLITDEQIANVIKALPEHMKLGE